MAWPTSTGLPPRLPCRPWAWEGHGSRQVRVPGTVEATCPTLSCSLKGCPCCVWPNALVSHVWPPKHSRAVASWSSVRDYGLKKRPLDWKAPWIRRRFVSLWLFPAGLRARAMLSQWSLRSPLPREGTHVHRGPRPRGSERGQLDRLFCIGGRWPFPRHSLSHLLGLVVSGQPQAVGQRGTRHRECVPLTTWSPSPHTPTLVWAALTVAPTKQCHILAEAPWAGPQRLACGVQTDSHSVPFIRELVPRPSHETLFSDLSSAGLGAPGVWLPTWKILPKQNLRFYAFLFPLFLESPFSNLLHESRPTCTVERFGKKLVRKWKELLTKESTFYHQWKNTNKNKETKKSHTPIHIWRWFIINKNH